MMALRLLIFRSVESLAKIHQKHSIEGSDVSESTLLLSLEVFAVTVDAVRSCTTNLQFASLFLEVGRQIEPSCMSHLFPLPLSGKHASKSPTPEKGGDRLDKFNARTVVDLFTLCVDEGALAASVSALPLMTSKDQARHYCAELLDEAIDSFVSNTHSRNVRYDKTEEERRVIGDIFRFGMKLEDADLLQENRDYETNGNTPESLEGSFDMTARGPGMSQSNHNG